MFYATSSLAPTESYNYHHQLFDFTISSWRRPSAQIVRVGIGIDIVTPKPRQVGVVGIQDKTMQKTAILHVWYAGEDSKPHLTHRVGNE
jgi:hypothetical protein